MQLKLLFLISFLFTATFSIAQFTLKGSILKAGTFHAPPRFEWKHELNPRIYLIFVRRGLEYLWQKFRILTNH